MYIRSKYAWVLLSSLFLAVDVREKRSRRRACRRLARSRTAQVRFQARSPAARCFPLRRRLSNVSGPARAACQRVPTGSAHGKALPLVGEAERGRTSRAAHTVSRPNLTRPLLVRDQSQYHTMTNQVSRAPTLRHAYCRRLRRWRRCGRSPRFLIAVRAANQATSLCRFSSRTTLHHDDVSSICSDFFSPFNFYMTFSSLLSFPFSFLYVYFSVRLSVFYFF